MSQSTKNVVAEHNDRFRAGEDGFLGSVVVTAGLAAHLTESDQTGAALVDAVRQFDNFTEDNDPYGEHDFGKFSFAGAECFWKIDLYNTDLSAYTPDPSDPKQTHRVLTIMLTHEY